MSLEAELAAVVERAVTPLAAEVRALKVEIAALRAASAPKYISLAEAAERLAVNTQTIVAMLERGELVERRAGRRRLVDVSSLRPRDGGDVARLARAARAPAANAEGRGIG